MLAAIVALCDPALAAIYVWEDDNGVLHFTDAPRHSGYTAYVPTGRPMPQPSTWDRDTIREQIWRIAPSFRLDPLLIEQVVRVESDYDPFALSHKGAMGLMQLMPETARLLGVRKPFDPIENLRGGMRYLRYLLDRFSGRLEWALAAYHAGENRVARARGVPDISSTKSYVRRILKFYEQARR